MPAGRALPVAAALAASVLLALVPAPARAAGTATLVAGAMTYTGDATLNSTQITVSGANYVVHDFTSTVTAGAGCVQSVGDALCPTAGVTSIAMNGLAGDDWLRLTTTIAVPVALDGGAGNDTLTGAAATDTLQGGGEDDVLDGSGGSDTMDGGAGFDTADYRTRTLPVIVTLAGGGANDGEVGEGDTVTGAERALGGSGADTLTGSDGVDDTLEGGNGNDQLNGLSGDDRLIGGQNSDVLDGGPGTDTADWGLWGFGVVVTLDGVANDGTASQGEADNVLTENVTGGSGNDTITGDGGPNVLTGGAGGDTLDGAGGADVLHGADGADTLRGGAGADLLDGGFGADTSTYADRTLPVTASRNDQADDGEAGEQDDVRTEGITGGSGADHLTGQDSPGAHQYPDTLTGGPGADVLDGLAGDDVLDGGAGADVQNGGDGADTLRGGTEADALHGDAGEDLADYGDHAAAVTVTLDGVANDGAPGENDDAGTEDVLGGSAADTLTGDDGANLLRGGGGADQLHGAGGPDALRGEAGADVLDGGGGVDTADYSQAGGVAITVTLDGAANDGATGENDNAQTENVTTAIGNDTLTGDGGDNVLESGGGADTLNGLGGNDVLRGGDGDDGLQGGDGDDGLDGGLGADQLSGGPGADGVTYAGRTAAVTVSLDGAANDGQAAEADNVQAEDVTGGSGNDTITGDAAPNRLTGGAGNDVLDAGEGDDVLDGGLGADQLTGAGGKDLADYSGVPFGVVVTLNAVADDGAPGEGDDVRTEDVAGGEGPDALTGDDGPNVLIGGAGADTLDGRGGDDDLSGGAGADHLISGAGADHLRAQDGEPDVLTCDAAVGKTVDADPADDTGACGTGGGGTPGGSSAWAPEVPLPALGDPVARIAPSPTGLPAPTGRSVAALAKALTGRAKAVRLRTASAPFALARFRCARASCTVGVSLDQAGATGRHLGEGLATIGRRTAAVRGALRPAGTARLRRARRLALVATFTITEGDSIAIVTQKVTLRLGGAR